MHVVRKLELSFLYAIHSHDLFYIPMNNHEYILQWVFKFQCQKKPTEEDNSERERKGNRSCTRHDVINCFTKLYSTRGDH